MVEQALLLDSAIRDWVLLPITVVILLVGLLRHNIIMLMNSPPKKIDELQLREQRIMARSGALRTNHAQVPPASFVAKRQQLLEDLDSGRFLSAPPKPPPADGQPEMPANPLSDPSALEGMMEPMKKSMVMMIPQQLIMGWISFFFSGFVVASVPISLPFPFDYFKGWLQRGLVSEDVQMNWVSSISWYFLVAFFGLNAVYRLLLGDDNAADSTRDMMGPLGGGGAAVPGQQGPQLQKTDFAKLHKTERDTLERVGKELLEAPPVVSKEILSGKALSGFGKQKASANKGGKRWVGDGVEERVLRRYGRVLG
ncbi:unnamed protein product [Parajaminaea phylloscopi]